MLEPTSSQPFGEVAAGYNLKYLGVTGVRFHPVDQELIGYLQRKLRGEPQPTDAVNDADEDVYSEHPKDLVGKLRKSFEGTWYLFSPRGRKYAGGGRPRRSTDDGVGFWKSMEAKKEVLGGADGKEVIGYKRGLTYHVFVEKPVDPKKPWKPTEWKMVEFVSINTDRPPKENVANPMLLNDYVLCKIMNKKALVVTDPGLPQSQSTEEEEEEGEEEPSDGSGASQEQQRSTSSEGPQDQQQDATPEAPNGEDAPAALLPAAAPEDFYPGANTRDDDLQQLNDDEPLNWTEYINTNIFGIFEWDDHIGTADVAGESPEDKQSAKQQQATSSVGGAGSPDEQQQAKPEATNEAATAAAAAAAASPKTVAVQADYDWEGWGSDLLTGIGSTLTRPTTSVSTFDDCIRTSDY